eukprot:49037-Pelagomonas_calceolata.AAC.1
MGMSAFEKNVSFILLIILGITSMIDHRQGKQHHPMWPARLSRYGHEGEIKPHCGRRVWVNPSRNI